MSALQRINYIVSGNCSAHTVTVSTEAGNVYFQIGDDVLAEYSLDNIGMTYSDAKLLNELPDNAVGEDGKMADDATDWRAMFKRIEPLMQSVVVAIANGECPDAAPATNVAYGINTISKNTEIGE